MLRHKEDIWNALRGFTAPPLFFAPFATGLPAGYEALVVVLLWLSLSDMNHILHLHLHHNLFRHKLPNRLLDIGLGLVTGMTAANWRIQHVQGHHRGPAHEYGPAKAWEQRCFTIAGALSYSTRTIWPIFARPLAHSFTQWMRGTGHQRRRARGSFFEQCLPPATATILLLVDPWLVAAYVVPWYVLVHFVTRYTDYLNHVGVAAEDVPITNNSVHRFYNRVRCNFGYHTAHHYRPHAHWTTLPAIHAAIVDRIPPRYIKCYSWSGLLMPYHFYWSVGGRM